MNTHLPAWTERYDGGSMAEEARIFDELARRMHTVQERNQVAAGTACPMRTLHAKIIAGLTNARIEVDPTLPVSLRVGHFQPGNRLPALVRLSNASGVPQPDAKSDMRGIAIRISTAAGQPHDLLMTNFPASHARNARQFVDFAVIASGDRSTMKERLVEHFGAEETQRMLTNIQAGMRPCMSVATEQFWSRGAYLWGDQAVRFELRPTAAQGSTFMSPDQSPSTETGDQLFEELGRRLNEGDVRYRLAIRAFVNEEVTPIEDASVPWNDEASSAVEIATLVLPGQDLFGDEGRASRARIDTVAFNPWNAPADFRPLGNLNRARGAVYGSSARHWQNQVQD